MNDTPCESWGDWRERSFKTIGTGAWIGMCGACRSDDCWIAYLAWEIELGIKLNASEHHKVTKRA